MTSETLISRPAALGTSDHSRESAETPSEWWAVVAVLFCGLLGALPVLLRGIPYHYDLGNHYHFALPFYDAVRAGRIYPGWLAESNFGFGDPSFRFYPPAFYYLLAAMRACLANWYAASLGSFAIISISGAAGAYYWARAFVPKQIAVAAAFLYAFMPYHVAEMYQSAQLAEYMAGAALLFSFAFTKRICDRGRMLHVGGLASSYALLVLTHLPLAVLGSVALLIYALILIPRERAADSIARLVSAIMLAIAATGFYWIRMISELGWLASNNQKSDPLLDYRANFLFSTFSPEKNQSIWWMNILMIATLVMLVPGVIGLRRRFTGVGRRDLVAILAVVVLAIGMGTLVSKPLWSIFPLLQKTQHPFRWIAVLSTAVPVLICISLPFWLQQARSQKRAFALLAGGALAVPLAFTVFQTMRDANYLNRSSLDQLLNPLVASPTINHWVPQWAAHSISGGGDDKCSPPSTPKALVEANGREVNIQSWESEHRRFSVSAGNAGTARIRTFYYPHWKATSGGHDLPTSADADGVLLVSLPAEATSVELSFREPSRSRSSVFLSMFGWMSIGMISLPFKRRRK